MRKWLKDLRAKRGFTQQDVSSLLGISQQFYSFIENGERFKDLPLSLMVKLSKLFEITIEKIAELEKQK